MSGIWLRLLEVKVQVSPKMNPVDVSYPNLWLTSNDWFKSRRVCIYAQYNQWDLTRGSTWRWRAGTGVWDRRWIGGFFPEWQDKISWNKLLLSSGLSHPFDLKHECDAGDAATPILWPLMASWSLETWTSICLPLGFLSWREISSWLFSSLYFGFLFFAGKCGPTDKITRRSCSLEMRPASVPMSKINSCDGFIIAFPVKWLF